MSALWWGAGTWPAEPWVYRESSDARGELRAPSPSSAFKDRCPPCPGLLHSQRRSLHQGVTHSTEVQGTISCTRLYFPVVVSKLWGLPFPLLIPQEGIRPGGLVRPGCLEGVSLLYCDLLDDSGLPHGAWKKVKVSNCAGKGSGKQTRSARKILFQKAP